MAANNKLLLNEGLPPGNLVWFMPGLEFREESDDDMRGLWAGFFPVTGGFLFLGGAARGSRLWVSMDGVSSFIRDLNKYYFMILKKIWQSKFFAKFDPL